MAHLFRLRMVVMAALLLVMVAACLPLLMKLRVLRHRAIVLCQRVERAMGPGETVFVNDAFTALLLRHYGDAELRQHVHRLKTGESSTALMPAGQEAIVVIHEDDPLEDILRAADPSLASSYGEMHRVIYFVHR